MCMLVLFVMWSQLGGFPSILSSSTGESTFQLSTLSNNLKADTLNRNGRHETGRRGCHCHIPDLDVGFDGIKTLCSLLPCQAKVGVG